MGDMLLRARMLNRAAEATVTELCTEPFSDQYKLFYHPHVRGPAITRDDIDERKLRQVNAEYPDGLLRLMVNGNAKGKTWGDVDKMPEGQDVKLVVSTDFYSPARALLHRIVASLRGEPRGRG